MHRAMASSTLGIGAPCRLGGMIWLMRLEEGAAKPRRMFVISLTIDLSKS